MLKNRSFCVIAFPNYQTEYLMYKSGKILLKNKRNKHIDILSMCLFVINLKIIRKALLRERQAAVLFPRSLLILLKPLFRRM